MEISIFNTLWRCSAIKENKLLNDVPSGSPTVDDLIFHLTHVEFLTESSTEFHLMNLCYVGGMKWSMAENNGCLIGGGQTKFVYSVQWIWLYE